MNQIAWQIFGGTKAKANTFIGGVASVITTSGALATKLGISVGTISNFTVVGSDIKCRITGSYSIQNNAFYGVSSLKYFNDVDGLVTSIGASAFEGTSPRASFFYFKNVTSIGNRCFYNDNKVFLIGALYIPNCTTMGSTVNDSGDVCFGINQRVSNLYVNPSMSTINSGGIEADIAYTSSFGFTNVRYVANFTAPNPITNLSVGTIYGTAVQLNFTAPTGSTNAIEFYEIYVNGVYNRTVTASGGYATGLTLNTAYTIEVKPVDIFYNKSTSNVVSATTATVLVYQDSLVSYYKLDSNSNDNWGSNNGTNTSVSYVAGKIGNAASFNGTTSKITANFAGSITTLASINFWVKLVNHTPSDALKTGILNITNEPSNSHYPFIDGNIYCGFFTDSRKTIGAGIVADRTQWHMVTVTADSVSNIWKFYQNGILVTTSTVGSFTMLSNGTLGKSLTTYFLNGLLDEVAIYNTALTQTEINLLYSSGQGTTI